MRGGNWGGAGGLLVIIAAIWIASELRKPFKTWLAGHERLAKNVAIGLAVLCVLIVVFMMKIASYKYVVHY